MYLKYVYLFLMMIILVLGFVLLYRYKRKISTSTFLLPQGHNARGKPIASLPYNDNDNDVCVVIPCVPGHVKHLNYLMESINKQDLSPHQIIVQLSETSHEKCRTVEHKLKEEFPELPISVYCTRATANAAENRNRGATHCSSTFLSFMDADDAMKPNRLSRVVDIMKKYNADACLHADETNNSIIHDADSMRDINRRQEESIHNPEWLQIPSGSSDYASVANPHITVRSNIYPFYSQDESSRWATSGEDTEYVRRLISSGINVVFTPEVLSEYRQELSASLFGYNG